MNENDTHVYTLLSIQGSGEPSSQKKKKHFEKKVRVEKIIFFFLGGPTIFRVLYLFIQHTKKTATPSLHHLRSTTYAAPTIFRVLYK